MRLVAASMGTNLVMLRVDSVNWGQAMKLPEDFRRHIENDTRNCVLMVGAGLSNSAVRARGRSLPDWGALTERMLHDLKGRVSKSTITRLRALPWKSYCLEVAEEFKKSTRSDAYALFLREQLDPPDFVRSSIHEILLAIEFKGIITTNFDRVIEFHTDRFRPLIYPHFLEEPTAFQRGRYLAKIHGCISSPNPAKNLVLTKSDYLRLSKNKKYQELMKSIFLANAILIVGFSLTDPDFLRVTESLRNVFHDGLPTIYALIRMASQEQCRRWREIGVEIIRYEEHRELRGFFSELLDVSESKYPSTRLKSLPLVFTKVRDIKAQAWVFYSEWKVKGSSSPRFGMVNVTVKGWRHLTQGSRPQVEVCHKLTLLRCAKEIVEKSWDSTLVRTLGPYKDEIGRTITRELHALRGQSRQRFRAGIWVYVILEVKKLVTDGSVVSTSFYSVYERRG